MFAFTSLHRPPSARLDLRVRDVEPFGQTSKRQTYETGAPRPRAPRTPRHLPQYRENAARGLRVWRFRAVGMPRFPSRLPHGELRWAPPSGEGRSRRRGCGALETHDSTSRSVSIGTAFTVILKSDAFRGPGEGRFAISSDTILIVSITTSRRLSASGRIVVFGR